MRAKSNITDNITLSGNGYQVRIVRECKEQSKYFSFIPWQGKRKALNAAKIWRDRHLKKVGGNAQHKRSYMAAKNNKSTGVLGVCHTISTDNRKGLTYLLYAASWVDHEGIKRTKAFRYGNQDYPDRTLKIKAFKAAKEFRKEWEAHVDADTLRRFNPDSYFNWRTDL